MISFVGKFFVANGLVNEEIFLKTFVFAYNERLQDFLYLTSFTLIFLIYS